MVYRTAPDQEQELDQLVCCLCDRGRREVTHLVRGLSGCVCSDCVYQTLEVLEPAHDALAKVRDMVRRDLAGLPVDAPYAISGALVRAALALSHNAPSVCRESAAHAARVRHHEVALEALAQIAEPELTTADRIALSFSCWETGQFHRGLAALAEGTWESPEDLMLRALNRAALELEVADHGPARIARAGEDLAYARQALAGLFPPSDPRAAYYEAVIEANTARQALSAGQTTAAKQALARAAHRGPLVQPWWQLLLGDVHEAMAERRKARQHWDAALRAAHPESRAAGEAQRRLGR